MADRRPKRKQWDREVIDPADLFRNQDLETSTLMTPQRRSGMVEPSPVATVRSEGALSQMGTPSPMKPPGERAKTAPEPQSQADAILQRLINIKNESTDVVGRPDHSGLYSNCLLLFLQFCDDHGLKETFDVLEKEAGLSFHRANEERLRTLLTQHGFGKALVFVKECYAKAEDELQNPVKATATRPATQQLSHFALKSSRDRARAFADMLYLLWKYLFIDLLSQGDVERARDVYDSELSRAVSSESDPTRKRWLTADRAAMASLMANPDTLCINPGSLSSDPSSGTSPPGPCDYSLWDWGTELRHFWGSAHTARLRGAMPLGHRAQKHPVCDVTQLRYPPVPGTNGQVSRSHIPYFAYAVADYFLARAPSTPLVQLVDIKKRYRRMTRDLGSYALRAGIKASLNYDNNTGSGGRPSNRDYNGVGSGSGHSSSGGAWEAAVAAVPPPGQPRVLRSPQAVEAPVVESGETADENEPQHRRKGSASVDEISRMVTAATTAINTSPSRRRKSSQEGTPPKPERRRSAENASGDPMMARTPPKEARDENKPMQGPIASHLTIREKKPRGGSASTASTRGSRARPDPKPATEASQRPKTARSTTGVEKRSSTESVGKKAASPKSPSGHARPGTAPVAKKESVGSRRVGPSKGGTVTSQGSGSSVDSAFFIPYAAEARIPLPPEPDRISLALQYTFDTSRHAIRAVALIEDEDTDSVLLACAGDDKKIAVFEVQTCEQLASLKGHSKAVTGIVFNPSNHGQLLSCSMDKTIRLWNWRDGSLLNSWNDHSHVIQQVSFMPLPEGGGQLFENRAVSCSSDHSLKMWDMERRKTFISTTNSNAAFTAFAIKPDGTSVIAAQEGGILRSYKVKGMTLMKTRKLVELRGIWMSGLEFHPLDPSLLLVTADRDTVVRLVDLRKDEVCTSYIAIDFMGTRGPKARFSPNGQYVYCGCDHYQAGLKKMGGGKNGKNGHGGTPSHKLFVWQTHSERPEAEPWFDHDALVTDAYWIDLQSQPGQIMVTAQANGKVNVFA